MPLSLPTKANVLHFIDQFKDKSPKVLNALLAVCNIAVHLLPGGWGAYAADIVAAIQFLQQADEEILKHLPDALALIESLSVASVPVQATPANPS